VERAHALLGRTVDEGRVWDVAATLRALGGESGPAKWRVVGRRQAGVLGAYAALFVPGLEGVVVIDPPVSHRGGPIFLGVFARARRARGARPAGADAIDPGERPRPGVRANRTDLRQRWRGQKTPSEVVR